MQHKLHPFLFSISFGGTDRLIDDKSNALQITKQVKSVFYRKKITLYR